MRKWLFSLQAKLILSVIVLVGVSSLLTFFYTYKQADQALKRVVREELRLDTAFIASQIDGDAVAALKPGDEKTPVYAALLNRLKIIKLVDPDIKYIYLMRWNGSNVVFALDPDYGNKADPGAAIGEEYKDISKSLFDGFVEPAVDEEFTKDKWGEFMSGYAPVRNSKKQTVGIVGVDMTSARFTEKHRFLKHTIYYVIAAGILFAIGVILIFVKTLDRDVRKLNKTAQAISLGNFDVEIELDRGDELGELAESFGRMKKSLLHAKVKVERASLEKSKFFAYASHELRSPLQSIVASADVLSTGLFGSLNDKQSEYAANIAANCKHMLGLIENLLNLARIEAGKIVFNPRPCNIKKLADDIFHMMSDLTKQHEIALDIANKFPDETVSMDEMKIKEVVINLINNAVKFSPKNGRITFEVAKVSLEDICAMNPLASQELEKINSGVAGYIQMNVRDTGAGIRSEDMDKLFKLFSQVGSDVPKGDGGAGLGLVIAKFFVEMHKGRIWVESKLGKGSNFIFVIPVV